MADNQSIVIKKIKKGGHGHHGGAWKVAYADFVTAMMAFFLLLWLLSSVPTEKLEGIADYFTPTIGLKDQMGIGFDGGTGDTEDGVNERTKNKPNIVYGTLPEGNVVELPESTNTEDVEADTFSKLTQDLERAFQQTPDLSDFKESVRIDHVPEGLRIQITDQDKHPMFEPSTAQLTSEAQAILSVIANIIRPLPNYLWISGHTDASLASTADYTNWELSTDRANTARRFLVSQKIDPERIAHISGKADFEPLDFQNLISPTNRRIALVLLKNSVLPPHKQIAPPGLLAIDPNRTKNAEPENVDKYLQIKQQDTLQEMEQ